MLKVTGHSDDIVYVEGDVTEEFYLMDPSEGYLAFSDGTLLHTLYDEHGIWRFNVMAKGTLFREKLEGTVLNDDSDEVKFNDGITWCVLAPGKDHAVFAKKAKDAN